MSYVAGVCANCGVILTPRGLLLDMTDEQLLEHLAAVYTELSQRDISLELEKPNA